MPFEFEGRLRRSNALQGLGALRSVADLVIPVPHQGVLKEVAESVRASDLLRCANEFVLGVARGLFRMLAGPDLIPLGVADLARVFRGRQVEGGSAAAEASGEHRARDVWERLVRHPFLTSTTPISEAAAVVLQVAGGPDLAIEELEWLEKMAQQASPRAQVLLGAVTHPSLAGRLSALLVVAPETVAPAPSEGDSGEPSEPASPGTPRAGALLFEDYQSRSPERVRGAGDRRGGGKGRAGARGLQQHIRFHAPQPAKELFPRIAAADLVVIFIPEANKDFLGTKFNEIFYLRRPVLHVGVEGRVSRTITERKLGASLRVADLAVELPRIVTGERGIDIDTGADLSEHMLEHITDTLVREVFV